VSRSNAYLRSQLLKTSKLLDIGHQIISDSPPGTSLILRTLIVTRNKCGSALRLLRGSDWVETKRFNIKLQGHVCGGSGKEDSYTKFYVLGMTENVRAAPERSYWYLYYEQSQKETCLQFCLIAFVTLSCYLQGANQHTQAERMANIGVCQHSGRPPPRKYATPQYKAFL
jgi:hypothetical protein